MAVYLLIEVELSSDEEFENTKVIDSISKADLDFINDDTVVVMMLIFIIKLIKNCC